jgi:hypothetical protein
VEGTNTSNSRWLWEYFPAENALSQRDGLEQDRWQEAFIGAIEVLRERRRQADISIMATGRRSHQIRLIIKRPDSAPAGVCVAARPLTATKEQS